MFLLMAILTIAGCVHMTTQTCVDPTGNQLIIEGYFNELLLLIAGIDPSDSQTIFQLACYNTSGRAIIDGIEDEVVLCQNLINETLIKDVVIGGLPLPDLFSRFGTVQVFCDCLPTIFGIMTLGAFDSEFVHVDVNAQYTTMLDYPFLCTPFSPFFPVDLADIISTLNTNAIMCAAAFDDSYVITTSNIVDVATLIGSCNSVTEAEFLCGVSVSTNQTFKDCIADVDASTATDEEKQCSRADCGYQIEDYCPSDVVDVYLRSVEFVTPGTYDFTCDSADLSTKVSGFLIVSATLYSIMVFAN